MLLPLIAAAVATAAGTSGATRNMSLVEVREVDGLEEA